MDGLGRAFRARHIAGGWGEGIVAAADGPPRTGIFGLRQFPGIARLELLHGLRHDRGLFRNPARGGAARQPRRSRHRSSAAGAGHGVAASADTAR